jgi:hypothetical protein
MQEGSIPKEEYDFGELHYKRKNIGARREEKNSELKESEPCTQIQIMEIPYGGGKEEESQSSPVIEELESPTQTGSCVESTTPCASPQSEITVEDLSNLSSLVKDYIVVVVRIVGVVCKVKIRVHQHHREEGIHKPTWRE